MARFSLLIAFASLLGCGSDQFAGSDAAGDVGAPMDASDTGVGTDGPPLDAGGDAIMVSAHGCSDGTREILTNNVAFPNLAGCSGGWSVPGIAPLTSLTPMCGRMAGNSSSNQNGTGCAVEDLCALGWHVCRSRLDVATSAPGLACPPIDAISTGIWVTRQTTDSNPTCVNPNVGSNNFVGCGSPTYGRDISGCSPLNKFMTIYECLPQADAGPWNCTGNEADTVFKPSSTFGGVLCCRGF